MKYLSRAACLAFYIVMMHVYQSDLIQLELFPFYLFISIIFVDTVIHLLMFFSIFTDPSAWPVVILFVCAHTLPGVTKSIWKDTGSFVSVCHQWLQVSILIDFYTWHFLFVSFLFWYLFIMWINLRLFWENNELLNYDNSSQLLNCNSRHRFCWRMNRLYLEPIYPYSV